MAEKSYDDMTVEQLEAELEERGLPKSGNKDDLVERLEKNDEVLAGDDGDGGGGDTGPEAESPGGRTQASPAENPAIPTKEPEEGQPVGAVTAPAKRRAEGERDEEQEEEEVGVFVGVDPDYQNFANDSDAPLLSESGVEREAEERSIKAQAETQARSARVGVTGYSPTTDYDLGREDVRGFSPTSKPDEEASSSEEEEEQG